MKPPEGAVAGCAGAPEVLVVPKEKAGLPGVDAGVVLLPRPPNKDLGGSLFGVLPLPPPKRVLAAGAGAADLLASVEAPVFPKSPGVWAGPPRGFEVAAPPKRPLVGVEDVVAGFAPPNRDEPAGVAPPAWLAC